LGQKNKQFLPKLFFRHNFWNRNARKSIKNSQVSDYSSFPLKSLVKKLALGIIAHGLRDLGQKCINLPQL